MAEDVPCGFFLEAFHVSKSGGNGRPFTLEAISKIEFWFKSAAEACFKPTA